MNSLVCIFKQINSCYKFYRGFESTSSAYPDLTLQNTGSDLFLLDRNPTKIPGSTPQRHGTVQSTDIYYGKKKKRSLEFRYFVYRCGPFPLLGLLQAVSL